MTVQQILLVVAAAVVGAFPAASRFFSRAVTYQQAMLALAVVRRRLLNTGGVPDAAAKAIEAITHSLVDTSDK
jgi:hypothetical protein